MKQAEKIAVECARHYGVRLVRKLLMPVKSGEQAQFTFVRDGHVIIARMPLKTVSHEPLILVNALHEIFPVPPALEGGS